MARAHRFARRASSASRSRSSRSRESLSDYELISDVNGPTERWTDKAKKQHRSGSEVHSSRPIVHHSSTMPAQSIQPDQRRRSFSSTSSPGQPSSLPSKASTFQESAYERALDTDDEESSVVAQESDALDGTIPKDLLEGTLMLKVSAKKQKRYVFKLDPDQGQIIWQSKKLRISTRHSPCALSSAHYPACSSHREH